jgi:subtilisin-like proprotein convertase family protein
MSNSQSAGRLAALTLLASVILNSVTALAQTVVWQDSFESSSVWSSWSVDNGVWEVGNPATGPVTNSLGYRTHESTNCAATVLSGNYPAGTSSRLIRITPFVVPAASQKPRLQFWHWYQFGGGSYGVVQIKLGAYTSTNAWTDLSPRFYNTGSGVWTRPVVDLSAYANKAVSIAFQIVADGNVADGWDVDEVRVVTGALQTLTPNVPESFELGLVDWYSETGTWEVGVPTSGPSTNSVGNRVFSGTNCAATVLSGNYEGYVSSRLISPLFTVPTASQSPRLRFWHWYNMAGIYGSVAGGYDEGSYGCVEIKVGTNDWQQVSPRYNNSGSGVWSQPSLDLAPFGGQTVQVAFHFRSGTLTAAGWYLDNVAVVTGEPMFSNPDGFELGIGDWAAERGTWEVGVPTYGPATNAVGRRSYSGTNCAATVLGGDYGSSADSRLISPRFVVPAAVNYPRLRFWHWYNMAGIYGSVAGGYDEGSYGCVEIKVGTNDWQQVSPRYNNSGSGVWSQPSLDLAPFGGQTVQVAFHFRSGTLTAAGWYLDNVAVVTGEPMFSNPDGFELGIGDWAAERGTWEVGVPTYGPATNAVGRRSYSGTNCAATVLGGDYGSYVDSRLTSPAFVVPSIGQHPVLRFWHWYNMAGIYGSVAGGYDEGSYGCVEIKVGTNDWQQVSPRYNNSSSGVWTQPSLDLAPYAGQKVQIAFHMHSGYNTSSGWYVDDITITSATPPTGIIEFKDARYFVNEGGTNATILVERKYGGAGAVDVTYMASDGTAAGGEDFDNVVDTLSWADGEQGVKTFTVPIHQDALAEGNETVSLQLFVPGEVASSVAREEATLVIIDDDGVLPLVTNIDYLRTLVDTENRAPTNTTSLFAVEGTVTTCSNLTEGAALVVSELGDLPYRGYASPMAYESISNKLYFLGGYDTSLSYCIGRIRAFDLESLTWSEMPYQMPYPILDGNRAVFIDGHFYVTPGWANNEPGSGWGSHKKLIDVDLGGSNATETAAFPYSRIWSMLSCRAQNKLFVFGGHTGSDQKGIFEYVPGASSVTQVTNMLYTHRTGTVTLGADGWMYIMGVSTIIERFNPVTRAVQTMKSTMPSGLSNTYQPGVVWHLPEENAIYFTVCGASPPVTNPTIYKFDYARDVLTDTGIVLPGSISAGVTTDYGIRDSANPASAYFFKEGTTNGSPKKLCRATLTKQTSSDELFFMQDNTNGVAVLFRGGKNQFMPQAGDRLRVTAPLVNINGLLALAPDYANLSNSVWRLSGSNPLPVPAVLDFASRTNVSAMEAMEARYVSASQVWIDQSGGSLFPTVLTNLVVTNLSGQTFSLTVNPNTDIAGKPIPAGPVKILGVLNQNDPTAPYTSGYALLPTRYADIIPPASGMLQFAVTNIWVGESNLNATLSVLRTGGSDGAVGVSFATANGSALAGTDYVATNGVLSWADGDSTTRNIAISILNDAVQETDELFAVTLTTPTGGASLSNAVASVNVVNDDYVVQPPSRTNVLGTTATFSITPSASVLSLQWYKNGALIPSATGAALNLFNVSEADAASYTVVISNIIGTVTSSAATLIVITPPAVTVAPASQTVSLGADALFTAAPSGTPPLGYQWFFQGMPITGATNASFTRANAQIANAGVYVVCVSNLAGVAYGSGWLSVQYTGDFVFSNTNGILIRDHNSASPYPSAITVSGLQGTVLKATVTLSNVTHTWVSDVDVLLAGPQGQKTLLMSDCGTEGVSDLTFTFDDNAAAQMPAEDVLQTGSYKPSNYAGNEGANDVFAAPAPVGPYLASLAVFEGTEPNGVWSLFVQDDESKDTGRISHGWQLSLRVAGIATGVEATVPAIVPSTRQWLEDGQFRFGVSSIFGSVLEVEARTNLTAGTWAPIGTVTNLLGNAAFTDPVTGLPQRFYRLRQISP